MRPLEDAENADAAQVPLVGEGGGVPTVAGVEAERNRGVGDDVSAVVRGARDVAAGVDDSEVDD